jgi:PPP family 3-phenylpropionic acid transporter
MTSVVPAAPRWVALRLAWFYAAYFIVIGIALPFWPTWLRSRGLSPEQIGVLLALSAWGKLLGHPLFRPPRRPPRRRQAAADLHQCGGVRILCALCARRWLLADLHRQRSCRAVPDVDHAARDGMAMGFVARHGLHYGRVRLWGSVAFIGAGAAAGWLLTGRTPDLVLPLVIAAVGLTLASCLTLPEWRGAAAQHADGGWLDLLMNRRLASSSWRPASSSRVMPSSTVSAPSTGSPPGTTRT